MRTWTCHVINIRLPNTIQITKHLLHLGTAEIIRNEYGIKQNAQECVLYTQHSLGKRVKVEIVNLYFQFDTHGPSHGIYSHLTHNNAADSGIQNGIK